ncbi:hypothetical protein BDZ94DRAFT_1253099 [Collybia nuda]|uniref:Uncharacterized protein n=1 Tax=Collybia nuda TaxID=64659 RepID=A0A9P5YBQ4_9AGAR|nr:hypothetical protein BDZ94DRAFT_1253099 [Collybia nuda]
MKRTGDPHSSRSPYSNPPTPSSISRLGFRGTGGSKRSRRMFRTSFLVRSLSLFRNMYSAVMAVYFVESNLCWHDRLRICCESGPRNFYVLCVSVLLSGLGYTPRSDSAPMTFSIKMSRNFSWTSYRFIPLLI